jgi:hypothetical protein
VIEAQNRMKSQQSLGGLPEGLFEGTSTYARAESAAANAGYGMKQC